MCFTSVKRRSVKNGRIWTWAYNESEWEKNNELEIGRWRAIQAQLGELHQPFRQQSKESIRERMGSKNQFKPPNRWHCNAETKSKVKYWTALSRVGTNSHPQTPTKKCQKRSHLLVAQVMACVGRHDGTAGPERAAYFEALAHTLILFWACSVHTYGVWIDSTKTGDRFHTNLLFVWLRTTWPRATGPSCDGTVLLFFRAGTSSLPFTTMSHSCSPSQTKKGPRHHSHAAVCPTARAGKWSMCSGCAKRLFAPDKKKMILFKVDSACPQPLKKHAMEWSGGKSVFLSSQFQIREFHAHEMERGEVLKRYCGWKKEVTLLKQILKDRTFIHAAGALQ